MNEPTATDGRDPEATGAMMAVHSAPGVVSLSIEDVSVLLTPEDALEIAFALAEAADRSRRLADEHERN